MQICEFEFTLSPACLYVRAKDDSDLFKIIEYVHALFKIKIIIDILQTR